MILIIDSYTNSIEARIDAHSISYMLLYVTFDHLNGLRQLANAGTATNLIPLIALAYIHGQTGLFPSHTETFNLVMHG